MWLHLHVGHGKTGSSFLQSWLALNAARLGERADIAYPQRSPISGRGEEAASRSRFSMGNGFILEELLESADDAVLVETLRSLAGDARSMLFSRERFMRDLPAHLPRLVEAAGALDGDGVRVLLFVRDPLEHAVSLYGEMVKAHGCADPLDEWLGHYRLLDHVERFLDAMEAIPSVECTILNYSRVRERLVEALTTWLGLDPTEAWTTPARGTVNRSLTAPELRVQRIANRWLGASAARIGRRLVEDLPRTRVSPPAPSPEACGRFEARLRDQVLRLNARLPEESQYRLGTPATAATAVTENPGLGMRGTRVVAVESVAALWGRLRGGPTPPR